MKKIKKIAVLALVLMLFAAGCAAPEEARQQDAGPEIEAPAPEPSVTVQENVISPPAGPEPEEEQEAEPEPQQPASVLEDFQNSEHLISANPAVGSVITTNPRKVMLVFNYPITSGTDIKLFDRTGTKRYDTGNTIIAEDDSVVAFVYAGISDPGVYMVIYKAVFPSKEGNEEGEGYYYFEYR